jgi:quinol monooxygenase YgiN
MVAGTAARAGAADTSAAAAVAAAAIVHNFLVVRMRVHPLVEWQGGEAAWLSAGCESALIVDQVESACQCPTSPKPVPNPTVEVWARRPPRFGWNERRRPAVMTGMSIHLRVQVKVNDGKSAEFEEVAKALVARAAEEAGTLSYRLFTDAPGSYTFLEAYRDPAASAAHGKSSRDLLAKLMEVATITQFDIYGDGDSVDQVAAAIPTASAHREVF